MVLAMQAELEIRAKNWPFKKLETIYFGGGTPSILSGNMLADLFETLQKYYEIEPKAEITLEANPDDISVENIKVWKSLGINRLSIGLQSSHDARLVWMNRIHTSEEGRRSVLLAQDLGIENISLDLMYNFPESTLFELEEDIQFILALSPKHISAYGLTIEPQTVFGEKLKKGKLIPLPEENAAIQFLKVSADLQSAGFEHYEISNFGRPGFHAVHNSNYWFQKPYLPIGPGAHGFDGETKFENLPYNALYIKNLLGQTELLQKVEKLSSTEWANEMIMTRLRTKWGLPSDEFKERTGFEVLKDKRSELARFQNADLLRIENQTIFLTESGKLLADRITMEMMY